MPALKFIIEETGRFKDLSGFIPGRSHVPTFPGAKADEFARTVGEKLWQGSASDTMQRLRQTYGLKRKDTQTSQETAAMMLETDHMLVLVGIIANPDSLDQFILRTTVCPKNEGAALSDNFAAFMGNRVNRLEFVPDRPFDIESIIDFLEDKFPAESLNYPVDFSTCRVTTDQLPVRILFEIQRLTLTASVASPTALFMEAYQILRGAW